MRTINYSLRVIWNFHWLHEGACGTAGKQPRQYDRCLLHAGTLRQTPQEPVRLAAPAMPSTPLPKGEAALGGAGELCQPAMSSQRTRAQSMNLQGPPEPAWVAALCCKKQSCPGPMFFQLCRHTDEPGVYCSAGHVFPCCETETISSGIVSERRSGKPTASSYSRCDKDTTVVPT